MKRWASVTPSIVAAGQSIRLIILGYRITRHHWLQRLKEADGCYDLTRHSATQVDVLNILVINYVLRSMMKTKGSYCCRLANVPRDAFFCWQSCFRVTSRSHVKRTVQHQAS